MTKYISIASVNSFLLNQMSTTFSSIYSILCRTSPERRDLHRIGCWQADCFISAYLDENLKCSVHCRIICLFIIHATITEQNIINIFDALINLFFVQIESCNIKYDRMRELKVKEFTTDAEGNESITVISNHRFI